MKARDHIRKAAGALQRDIAAATAYVTVVRLCI